jgi:hypothetical protein
VSCGENLIAVLRSSWRCGALRPICAKREAKMSQVDPWEKAAECARAIQISLDPHPKAVLTNLQQMWIALADERRFLTSEELAREMKALAVSMRGWPG